MKTEIHADANGNIRLELMCDTEFEEAALKRLWGGGHKGLNIEPVNIVTATDKNIAIRKYFITGS